MKIPLTRQSFLIGSLTTLIYFLLSLYLINYRIILSTLFGNYPITFKTSLLTSLAIGSIKVVPAYEAILISLTAILVGTNTSLVYQLLKRIKEQGKLKLTTGGLSLLAVAGAGCPSCGISVLSVLGISSSALPIKGVFLQILTLGLLIISLAYNLKKLKDPAICKVK